MPLTEQDKFEILELIKTNIPDHNHVSDKVQHSDLLGIDNGDSKHTEFINKDGTTAFTGTGAGFRDEDTMTSNDATAAASQQSIKAYADTKLAKDGSVAFSGTGDGFKDEDTMSSNSATAAASQQSIKAYHDATMFGFDSGLTQLNYQMDLSAFNKTDVGTPSGFGSYYIVAGSANTWSFIGTFPLKLGELSNLQFNDGKTITAEFFLKPTVNDGDKSFGFGTLASFQGSYNNVLSSACFAMNGTDGYTRTADTSTATTNAEAFTAHWHIFKIEYILGTSAKFYIDGTLEQTHTTNISAEAADIYFGVGGANSLDACHIGPVIIKYTL